MLGKEEEIDGLLEDVWRTSGLDFRCWARASLRRRIGLRLAAEGLHSIAELRARIAADEDGCLGRLMRELASRDPTMFRQPRFHRIVRQRLMPLLRTYPTVNVWCPGCGTGEQVWGLAIVLREEGLSDRLRLWATDASPSALEVARAGRYPVETVRGQQAAYREAGGRGALGEYFALAGQEVEMRPVLREGLVFAQHDVTSDGSFREFQMIVCRDAMIYWDASLQRRAFELFHASLCRLGVLAVGGHESLRLSPAIEQYEVVDEEARVYRRRS